MRRTHFATQAPRRFFAPGRVNLIGEHTDYTGGLVLPVAIDLGVTVEVEAADELALVSESFDADEGWRRYVDAVAAELGVPTGMRGTIRSTVPAGAGLSSSAALEIAVALAFCAFSGVKLSPAKLVEAARRAEERAVGVPCGVMDQAAAVLGRAGHAILIDTATFEHRYVRLPLELELVVLDSGVRRRLEDSRYAERRAEVERGDPRRLRHVESENRRVREVVDALERADLAALGPLFRAGRESLPRRLRGVDTRARRNRRTGIRLRRTRRPDDGRVRWRRRRASAPRSRSRAD